MYSFLYDIGFDYIYKSLKEELKDIKIYEDFNNITLIYRLLYEISNKNLIP